MLRGERARDANGRILGSTPAGSSLSDDVGVMGRHQRAGAAVAATNGGGFVELYRRCVDEVYSYLASRLGEGTAAEDLTQEVFIAAARRAAAGDSVDVAWLIAVARHKLIDRWRAERREVRRLALVPSPKAEPAVEQSGPLDSNRTNATLAGLNPTYRPALVLRHVDGLSVADVATQLGRSVRATEQILTRARVAFRTSYRGIEHE